jgi:hypothetical protein
MDMENSRLGACPMKDQHQGKALAHPDNVDVNAIVLLLAHTKAALESALEHRSSLWKDSEVLLLDSIRDLEMFQLSLSASTQDIGKGLCDIAQALLTCYIRKKCKGYRKCLL